MRLLHGLGLAVPAAALMVVPLVGIARGPVPDAEIAPVRTPLSLRAPDAPKVMGLPWISPSEIVDAAASAAQYNVPPAYNFYFTRAVYSGRSRGGWGWGGGRGGGGSWRTDFPEAEYFFTSLLSRLIDIDVYEDVNPMELDNPEIRKFPFLYFVEPGQMSMTPSEIEGLRSYLEAGGFIMLDDYWGTYETRVVEDQMRRVLPDRVIVDIPLDHPIFHSVYDIEEIRQVPNVGNGTRGGRTDEGDNSEIPSVRGIFDDHGRLMVIINQNTDLGDAWEHGENPFYPLEYSTYATEVGINTVVYAMSH